MVKEYLDNFLFHKNGELKENIGIISIVLLVFIVMSSLYYYLYVYDPLKPYRRVLVATNKRCDNNDGNNLAVASTSNIIGINEMEVTYSMWLKFENLSYKYADRKHILSHGKDPRFYDKWTNHKMTIEMGKGGSDEKEDPNTMIIQFSSAIDNVRCSTEACITKPTDNQDENYQTELDKWNEEQLKDEKGLRSCGAVECKNLASTGMKEYLGPFDFNNKPTGRMVKLHNIPIKKWFHLCISVTADIASIYINGNLVKDVGLGGNMIHVPKSTIYIASSRPSGGMGKGEVGICCPNNKCVISNSNNCSYGSCCNGNNQDSKHKCCKLGFGGKIGKVEYFNKSLESSEVFNLYREGNKSKLKNGLVKNANKLSRGCRVGQEDCTIDTNSCCPGYSCSNEDSDGKRTCIHNNNSFDKNGIKVTN